jgi:hypothetical protein
MARKRHCYPPRHPTQGRCGGERTASYASLQPRSISRGHNLLSRVAYRDEWFQRVHDACHVCKTHVYSTHDVKQHHGTYRADHQALSS